MALRDATSAASQQSAPADIAKLFAGAMPKEEIGATAFLEVISAVLQPLPCAHLSQV